MTVRLFRPRPPRLDLSGWSVHVSVPPSDEKISFGGIPNSSNIDILMPYAIFDCMGVFLRSGFAHVDNVIPVIKAITWLLLSRLQGNKPHRNFPEPSEPFLLNLRQHTPEPSEIFQNLPELASGTYTVLHRNSPEPSGTCVGNLHHFTKELSGTFRNPPPEPTPAHSGTLRNSPEPSGTFLRNRLLRPAPAHTGAYLG